jgi:hypothetical protein
MEYKLIRLEGTTASAAKTLGKHAADGWRVHTWTVLLHKKVPNKSGSTDELLQASVLFEREAAPAAPVDPVV